MDTRSSVAKTSARVSTHALTWLQARGLQWCWWFIVFGGFCTGESGLKVSGRVEFLPGTVGVFVDFFIIERMSLHGVGF